MALAGRAHRGGPRRLERSDTRPDCRALADGSGRARRGAPVAARRGKRAATVPWRPTRRPGSGARSRTDAKPVRRQPADPDRSGVAAGPRDAAGDDGLAALL